MEANIHYPTDAGLLADGVKLLTRTVKKVKERGIAGKEKFRVCIRSVKRRLLKISKFLKNKKENVVSQIDQVTKKIAGITEKVVEEARSVKEALRSELFRSGQKASSGLKKLDKKFTEQIGIMEKVLDQTREVISGNRKIADRIVSLHDPGARPIRKGKLKSPMEFGRKLLLTETQEGIITDYRVFEGNPPDKKLLLSTVENHTGLLGEPPWGAAADRGFYSSGNEKK